MPTYRVKIRFDIGGSPKEVIGTVESGPGAHMVGVQFLAVVLDPEYDGGPTPTLNIAIHRIYTIEQLDDVRPPAHLPYEEPKQGKLSADGTHRAWSGSDPQPMEPINTVWDKDGHRWEHQEGMNLWESDAHQYPEPWAELLSYFGPVTDRLVV
ncbi:hypothetical protein [Rhodococcoides fascians]|uniref:hypothetical protein n=1 Tax=Rhodococcoides fascians TaxID=1828 RepID=UPI000A8351B5|nr:hypothetical protein [Rhodococcus fascians]